jgi:hypothetical protein
VSHIIASSFFPPVSDDELKSKEKEIREKLVLKLKKKVGYGTLFVVIFTC